MNRSRPSRRQVLRASLIGGIAVYLAPLGSRAFAALFEEQLLTRPDWNGRDGVLKYRIDGTSKVTGGKVFARDIRARDMPHWPQQQSHALVLRATMADRSYAGFDLSVLGADLAARPRGDGGGSGARRARLPGLLRRGHAAAGRQDAGLSGPGRRDPDLSTISPASASPRKSCSSTTPSFATAPSPGRCSAIPGARRRFVRVGGKTPYDDDVFSCLKQGPISPPLRTA